MTFFPDSKRLLQLPRDGPGPGEYHTEQLFLSKVSRHGFNSTSPRNLFSLKKLPQPGPGHYDHLRVGL
jgi:hypothetical protein